MEEKKKKKKKSYLLFILSPWKPCPWQKNDQKKRTSRTLLWESRNMIQSTDVYSVLKQLWFFNSKSINFSGASSNDYNKLPVPHKFG